MSAKLPIDQIPFFMALFHITMRLDDPFEGVHAAKSPEKAGLPQ